MICWYRLVVDLSYRKPEVIGSSPGVLILTIGNCDPGSFFYLQMLLLLSTEPVSRNFHLQILYLFNHHYANVCVKQLLFCALIINFSRFSKLDFAADKSKIFCLRQCFPDSSQLGLEGHLSLVGKGRFAVAHRVQAWRIAKHRLNYLQ